MPFPNPNLPSMLRFSALTRNRPEPSTADAGGFNPTKRFYTGIGPEPKTPWQSMFQTPQIQTPFQAGSGIKIQPEQPEPDQGSPYLQNLLNLTKPGPAMSAYQDILHSQPTQEEYAPSKWRILAATIGGAGAGFRDPGQGAAIAENINFGPYRRAREAWADKAGGLGEAANIEGKLQGDQASAYIQSITRDQADRTFRHTLAKDDLEQWNKDRTYNLDRDRLLQANYGQGEDLEDGSTRYLDTKSGKYIIVPGSSIAAANLRNSRRNTDINAFSAETGRLNAQTNRMNYGLGVDRLRSDEERDWYRLGQPNPNYDKPAEQATLAEIWGEGDRRFVEREIDDSTHQAVYRLKGNVDTNSPVYKDFLNKFKIRQRAKVTQKPPNSLVPDDTIGYTPEGYSYSLEP